MSGELYYSAAEGGMAPTEHEEELAEAGGLHLEQDAEWSPPPDWQHSINDTLRKLSLQVSSEGESAEASDPPLPEGQDKAIAFVKIFEDAPRAPFPLGDAASTPYNTTSSSTFPSDAPPKKVRFSDNVAVIILTDEEDRRSPWLAEAQKRLQLLQFCKQVQRNQYILLEAFHKFHVCPLPGAAAPAESQEEFMSTSSRFPPSCEELI